MRWNEVPILVQQLVPVESYQVKRLGLGFYILFLFANITIFLLPLGCNDNALVFIKSGCSPNLPDIVPRSAYDSPIWHPGGKLIGFNHTPLVEVTYPYGADCMGVQHFQDDSAGFWLMNNDGSNIHRIFPYPPLLPAWSADGEWIAFCLADNQDNVNIFKMRFTGNGFDTTTLVQLTRAGRNFFPTWNPHGHWIAFSASLPVGYQGTWVINDTGLGSDAQQLGLSNFAAWSLDGIDLMAIGTSFVVYHPFDHRPADTLFEADPANNYGYPSYSSTGDLVGFVSGLSDANQNIWLMDTMGHNLRQLTTEGVDRDQGKPFSWSPNSSQIIYASYRSSDWSMQNGVLWMLDITTHQKKQLTFNGSISSSTKRM